MSFLSIALMIAAGVLAVFGTLQQRKGAPWGRPLAAVAAVVAILIATSTMYVGARGPDVQKIRRTLQQFQEIAGRKMGRYLAENYSGQKVLALGGMDYSVLGIPPQTQNAEPPPWAFYLEGLKKGMGDSLTLVDTVHLPIPQEIRQMAAQMRKEAQPGAMEELMTELFFPIDSIEPYNEALRPYLQKVDIIVLLEELPYGVENLQLWRMPNPPRLAVLNPSAPSSLKTAISSGHIIGAVAYRPDYDFQDRSIPRDLDKAFSKRFLLITPDNLEQIESEHQIF